MGEILADSSIAFVFSMTLDSLALIASLTLLIPLTALDSWAAVSSSALT
jgi:hypothetical protein